MRVKKFVLLLLLTIGLLLPVGSAAGSVPTVLLNGKSLEFEVDPVFENNCTMVPFRTIFEALGATINWDQNTSTITATKGNVVIIMQQGDVQASINNITTKLDAAPKIINNRMLVPLRFVSQALGARVGWYANCNLITISSNTNNGQGKKVALTFDDGPDDIYTNQILDVLKEKNALATFFLLGNNTEKYPEVAKRIHAEGHDIGIHSYDHPNFKDLSKEAVLTEQIEKPRAIFKSLIGIEPTIYRPPYSSVTKEQLEYLSGHGYTQVLWKANTEDYRSDVNTPAYIVSRALDYCKNGGIVIMHCTNGDNTTSGNMTNTVKALPVIIEEFRQLGMELCPISQIAVEHYNSQHYNSEE